MTKTLTNGEKDALRQAVNIATAEWERQARERPNKADDVAELIEIAQRALLKVL